MSLPSRFRTIHCGKKALRSVLNPATMILLAGIAIVVGINRYTSQALPGDLQLRLNTLSDARMPVQADEVYRSLLKEDPSNVDLHIAYIQNHFETPEAKKSGRAGEVLRSYYSELASTRGMKDIGFLGLGLIEAQERNYSQAITFYGRVANRGMKFLNSLTGSIYLESGEKDLAEEYFRREIYLNGDTAGAVPNLASLYLERGQFDRLSDLATNPRTAPYIKSGARRSLALANGDAGEYLRLVIVLPLQNISLHAGLVALLICVIWMLYLWRINVFSPQPFSLQVGVFLLGALSALVSLAVSDSLGYYLPIHLGDHWYASLFGALLYIGVVEELVKFLPVVLVVALTKNVKEPIGLITYGSLSALGFATLENSLYFSQLGLGLVLPRFVFSTVLHLAMTSLLMYSWAQAHFWKTRKLSVSLIFGFGLAAVIHGLFDYFLGSPGRLQLLSYVVLFIAVREYYRIIHNTLNFSAHPESGSSGERRLSNYSLLFSAVFLLLIIVYLYDNFHFSTEIANRQLFYAALLSLPAAFGIFGALGKFQLRPGNYKRALSWPIIFRKLA